MALKIEQPRCHYPTALFSLSQIIFNDGHIFSSDNIQVHCFCMVCKEQEFISLSFILHLNNKIPIFGFVNIFEF